MPPAGFEPAIPASERPQAHTLDRAANGIGYLNFTGHSLYHHMYYHKALQFAHTVYPYVCVT